MRGKTPSLLYGQKPQIQRRAKQAPSSLEADFVHLGQHSNIFLIWSATEALEELKYNYLEDDFTIKDQTTLAESLFDDVKGSINPDTGMSVGDLTDILADELNHVSKRDELAAFPLLSRELQQAAIEKLLADIDTWL
jgi:uncharacterized protein YoaH (UPF0181 family)